MALYVSNFVPVCPSAPPVLCCW